MAENPAANKKPVGTFAGGQGPILGMEIKNEKEPGAPFGGEMKDAIKGKAEGRSDPHRDGAEGPLFDLHSKSYAGPENWQPTNKGTVTPGK